MEGLDGFEPPTCGLGNHVRPFSLLDGRQKPCHPFTANQLVSCIELVGVVARFTEMHEGVPTKVPTVRNTVF